MGTSGSSRIAELAIDDANVAGYAFFEGGKLSRAVLLNSQAFLSTQKGARGSENVTLKFTGGGAAPKSMVVKRLKIKCVLFVFLSVLFR